VVTRPVVHNPTAPGVDVAPPAVFYHVAAMNTWRSVVREQLRLLAHVGLVTDVTVGLLGDAEDAATVTALAAAAGVNVTIGFRQPDLALAELPTLALLHAWARRQRFPRPVLYLHTKGVSRPADRVRIAWRRLMQRHVVADWAANVCRLADVDLVGVNWIESPLRPHFSGNVWVARSDWVAQLDPPQVYRLSQPPDFTWGGEPWRQRMFAETWVASRPGHRVTYLACVNQRLREGTTIYDFDTTIPGFRYEGDLAVPDREP
jgi:hypothetical protein